MNALAGVSNQSHDEESTYKRIDAYWFCVQAIVDKCGKKKYSTLWSLVKCLLSLSHGNADPERGFSLRFLLQVHGNAIQEETIEAVRLVKDFILYSGGTNNVQITKEMIISSRDAYWRYDMNPKEKEQEIQAANELKKDCRRKREL